MKGYQKDPETKQKAVRISSRKAKPIKATKSAPLKTVKFSPISPVIGKKSKRAY